MRETFYRLHASGLTKPVCFAVAADIHSRPYRDILDSLHRHKPDMILLPGDYISGTAPAGDCLKVEESDLLAMTRAFAGIAPTYLSLGNHEWMLCPEDFARIQETGVQILDNTWTRIDGIVLGGLTSGIVSRYRRKHLTETRRYPRPLPYRKVPFLKQFTRGSFETESYLLPETDWLEAFAAEPGYHVLLSHHPEYWSYTPLSLRDLPVELIISGHAHGGQIRYYNPFRREWRGMFAPFQGLFPDYTGGIHKGPHGTMIISRGLSNTARPVPRLFNPREMVYITLST